MFIVYFRDTLICCVGSSWMSGEPKSGDEWRAEKRRKTVREKPRKSGDRSTRPCEAIRMGVNRWFLGVLSVCCGLALSAWAADGTIQPLESIEQQAHEFVLAQYRDRAEPPEIQSRKLDPRLRLLSSIPACDCQNAEQRWKLSCPMVRNWWVIPQSACAVLVLGRGRSTKGSTCGFLTE